MCIPHYNGLFLSSEKDIWQMQTCFDAVGLPLSLTDGKEEQQH